MTWLPRYESDTAKKKAVGTGGADRVSGYRCYLAVLALDAASSVKSS